MNAESRAVSLSIVTNFLTIYIYLSFFYCPPFFFFCTNSFIRSVLYCMFRLRRAVHISASTCPTKRRGKHSLDLRRSFFKDIVWGGLWTGLSYRPYRDLLYCQGLIVVRGSSTAYVHGTSKASHVWWAHKYTVYTAWCWPRRVLLMMIIQRAQRNRTQQSERIGSWAGLAWDDASFYIKKKPSRSL